MREENARRLSAMLWRQRLRQGAVVVGVIAVLAGFAIALFRQQVGRLDRTVDVAVHDATVLSVKPSGNAPGAGVVHVHLPDGREVDAFNTLRVMPRTGAHVVVNEARHESGKHTFDVVRLAE
jgi:hypothetical protein